jgi:glycerol transport system substrate-binding protein
MDGLAQAQDETLERLARAEPELRCAPKIGPAEDPAVWLARPSAPKPVMANEKPPGRTIAYQDLIASWRERG